MKSPPRATLTARTYASKQSSRSGDSRRCDLRLCTSATARATASTTRRDRPLSTSRPIAAARYWMHATSSAQVTDRHHPPPQCRLSRVARCGFDVSMCVTCQFVAVCGPVGFAAGPAVLVVVGCR